MIFGFFEAPHCQAKSKRSGLQCRKAAMQGKSVCGTHGGASRPHQILDKYSPNQLICNKLLLSDDVGAYTVVCKDC